MHQTMPLLRSLFVALLATTTLIAMGSPLDAQTASPASGDGTEIVGGVDAAPGEFPYQVALLTRGVADRSIAQFCGGSIISPTVVLTAAHCFFDPGTGAPVVAGSVDVLSGTIDLSGTGGSRVPATAIAIHPQYGFPANDYDVAIVEVGTALIGDPVKVVQPGQEQLFGAGTNATVTGWGALASGGPSPTRLQKVDIPLQSDADCLTALDALGGGFDASSMFCGGLPQGGVDACQGDSGGPLAVTSGNEWVQVGVVSWGYGCADPNSPGVYSRISAMSAFIGPYLNAPPPGPCTDHGLSDVPAWIQTATTWAVCNTYMTGFPDNTFRPDLAITRGQAARVAYRIAGSPPGSPANTFPDVPNWLDPAVDWMSANGYMTGFTDGNFGPNDPITRGQEARMLFRIAGSPSVPSFHPFSDVPNWLDLAVDWHQANNYMAGYPDNTFRDTLNITRGQVVNVEYNINK